MNSAEELYHEIKKVDFTIDMKPFQYCADGAIRDVVDTERSGYYQWLPKLIKQTQPKQIVELGGAMGVACLAMLQTLPQDSKLYSITLAEGGQEFSFIKGDYPNLVKIVGDDLDLNNWPKDLDLSKTDIWFIDSEHTYEQVRKEIDLYKPFFKEGAILLFDDTHINAGLSQVWSEICNEIPGSKYESDLHYTGYGIVIVGKEEPIVRDPHLIVYGSSYDRGLEHLLAMWPEIKEAVPDAKLNIFYGWDLFDVGYRDNSERMAWKERMNELMKQDGITHLGRISHEAVKKEFEKAGIWAYPTHFGEISCITGMKAQAYGAVPCVVNYAALQETVQYGVKIEGDIWDPETKELYKGALIALLNDEKHQEEVRKEMMPWAQEKFAWSNVAKQWDEEFRLSVEKTLDQQVEELLEDNQALKAWELVKDTDWPKKDRLWLRVKHAFNEEDYNKYYSEQLIENPVDEALALDCIKLHPRFAWVVKEIEKLKPKTAIDLGCADGYLTLTLANKGIESLGLNLYKPSIELAKERAKKHNLTAKFACRDLMKAEGTYDAVILFEVLEHVPNPQATVDKCMSLLNPGGSFFLSTPSPQHIGIEQHKKEEGRKPNDWDDGLPAGHLRIFTEDEIRELCSKYDLKQLLYDAEGCFLVEVKNHEK